MAAAKKSASKKPKKMTAAVKAKLAAYKKSKKGGAKKAPKKSLTKSQSSSLGHAHNGYKLSHPGKNATDKARLTALERNQVEMAHGMNAMAVMVLDHDKALVGAGLLKARGARKSRKG